MKENPSSEFALKSCHAIENHFNLLLQSTLKFISQLGLHRFFPISNWKI